MIKRIKVILKKEYFIREIVTLFVIVTSMLGFVLYESLAIFEGSIEKTSVASITTGTITFDTTSNNESYNASTKQITIPAGETIEMDMTIKNTTPIPAKYKFYYKPISHETLPDGTSVSIIDSFTDYIAYSGEIETYKIPQNGTYKITARGAVGTTGNKYSYTGTKTPTPGKGARLTSEFELTEGDELTIVVGGEGSVTQATAKDGTSGAGGGGTFIFKTIDEITDSTYQITKNSKYYETLLVAAGGGGTGDSSYKGAATNGYDGLGETWIEPGGTAYSTKTAAGTSTNTSASLSAVLGISQFITYNSVGGYYTRNSGVCKGGFGGGGCADDSQSYGGGWSGSSYQAQSFSSGTNTSGRTGDANFGNNGFARITLIKEPSTTTFDNGVLETNVTTTKKMSITNSSTEDITLEIGVEVGYQNNTISLSSGNSAFSLCDLLGDVTQDGVVTEEDAELVHGIIMGAEYTDEEYSRADVNNDGYRNMNDIRLLFSIFSENSPKQCISE